MLRLVVSNRNMRGSEAGTRKSERAGSKENAESALVEQHVGGLENRVREQSKLEERVVHLVLRVCVSKVRQLRLEKTNKASAPALP